ncbi:EAL domain-containing protein [Pokkaliibacter sp. MBI-7]|uniref:bifunctional diguanylate cyclase/phosphodiesterase n=1 Tax=Pokkaliibacter sp. MBI-7 TaxID=3040600 RepID=UPI00244D58CB|nr:EAL domain-containing protein [Pokkaliibacter sp. MBI-7]MDH2433213.1 EAL domain-containing protein [Pokkaliibacter sp. MBI-7]
MPTQLPDLFVSTLEQLSDAVIVTDGHGVLLFNAAAERFWDCPRQTVLAQPLAALWPAGLPAVDELTAAPRDISLNIAGIVRRGRIRVSRAVQDSQTIFTVFITPLDSHLRQAATVQGYDNDQHLQLLSMVTDRTDNAIIITDGRWRTLYINDGFSQMFGYSSNQMLGAIPTSIIAPYAEQEQVDALHDQLAKGQPFHAEELIYTRDGRRIWCSVTTNPVLDEQGQLLNTLSVLTDITQSKMHELLQNRVLSAMVREEPLETVMNTVCREVEHLAPEVIASILRVDEQGRLHPLAGPSLPAEYNKALEGVAIGEGVGSCGTAAFIGQPVIVTDIASHPYWTPYKHLALPHGLKACWSTPIRSSSGRILGTFAFYYRECRGPNPLHQRMVEVSTHLCALALEREEARAHIRQLAFYDSLTKLPNRSLLHARADQALTTAEHHGDSIAVLFIDLDRFKQVNDSLGHPAGDELLRVIAQRLTENLRHVDIVGRLSGDEFVMVLPRYSAQALAEAVEQLKSRISQPFSIGSTTLIPSASIGISLFPNDGHDMESLIHRADMAMYQAKSMGRGHVSYFSHQLNEQAQQRMALENALRDALDNGGLQLHYQPQINLADGSLYGVEALARWQHPEFGSIPPTRFIPLAEECGLIGQLGHWAVQEACRQLAAWRRQGLQIPAVSVNLSPSDFHNLDLPQQIAHTLQHHQLQPQDLTLEITESVLMDTHPSTLTTLDAIHSQGVNLAMDDFGTGYSSLSYLRRLPIHELKLDRSFVSDLESDATARALSEAVMRIGESLRLIVVAEGIEEEGQQQILRQQGYQVGQGYLFSRPVPAAELQQWLQQWRAAAVRHG